MGAPEDVTLQDKRKHIVDRIDVSKIPQIDQEKLIELVNELPQAHLEFLTEVFTFLFNNKYQ